MSDDRTYLVTGANRGIGRGVAEALAERGARVVLACRDLAAGEDAEEDIRRRTGNRELYVVELDLASPDAVRAAAADVQNRFDALHGLINNAGIFSYEQRQSADGLELHMAVNHLGHFLFTILLRDLLIGSAPARVVTVSSRAHVRGRIDYEEIEAGGGSAYDPYQAYADSKLANVLFGFELARRFEGTGVTSNTVHPGTVQTQMLEEYLVDPPPGLGNAQPLDQGAEHVLWVATAPELEGVSGRYFEHQVEIEASPKARGVAAARRLWDWSIARAGAQEADWGGPRT